LQDMKRIDSSNRLRLLGFGLFVTVHFLSCLQRVAMSVVADALTFELGLDSVALGFMSSGFFISYALTQPVMGILCDKVSPERVSAGALIVAAFGTFLFAGAKGFAPAFCGRVMMGVGLAAGLIPGMKFIAVMFPPEVFSTYNALFAAIGNTGALVGAAPLAWLTAKAGWRPVFRGLAFAAVLLSGLCWLFTSRYSTRKVPDSGSRHGSASYSDVIRNCNLQLLALFMFARFGSQAAFQGLWGVPYISSVYGVNSTLAAAAVSMIATGYVISAPFMGRLADALAARGMGLFIARRRLLIATTLCYVVAWMPIVLAKGLLSFRAICVLLFIMGVCLSSSSLVFGIAKDLLPSKVSGFATGLVNIMAILGGAVMPPLVGWFIKLLAAEGLQGGAMYSRALAPCLIAAALALSLMLMVRKLGDAPSEVQGGGHSRNL